MNYFFFKKKGLNIKKFSCILTQNKKNKNFFFKKNQSSLPASPSSPPSLISSTSSGPIGSLDSSLFF